mmetsp:Transcript_22554/g.70704  ORF Transcript_22554/g.70704 Transcript_22554/m.70704 type:complete len:187 (+) Transcript_22554:616-1176(+)
MTGSRRRRDVADPAGCASATAGACKSGFRYSAQLGVCDQQKKGCESLPTCCTPCEPEDKKCGNCVSEAWPAPRRRRDLRGGRRRCHRVGPDFGRQENCSSSSQWDGMGGLLLVLGILLVAAASVLRWVAATPRVPRGYSVDRGVVAATQWPRRRRDAVDTPTPSSRGDPTRGGPQGSDDRTKANSN